jgi:hypothetical protein
MFKGHQANSCLQTKQNADQPPHKACKSMHREITSLALTLIIVKFSDDLRRNPVKKADTATCSRA